MRETVQRMADGFEALRDTLSTLSRTLHEARPLTVEALQSELDARLDVISECIEKQDQFLLVEAVDSLRAETFEMHHADDARSLETQVVQPAAVADADVTRRLAESFTVLSAKASKDNDALTQSVADLGRKVDAQIAELHRALTADAATNRQDIAATLASHIDAQLSELRREKETCLEEKVRSVLREELATEKKESDSDKEKNNKIVTRIEARIEAQHAATTAQYSALAEQVKNSLDKLTTLQTTTVPSPTPVASQACDVRPTSSSSVSEMAKATDHRASSVETTTAGIVRSRIARIGVRLTPFDTEETHSSAQTPAPYPRASVPSGGPTLTSEPTPPLANDARPTTSSSVSEMARAIEVRAGRERVSTVRNATFKKQVAPASRRVNSRVSDFLVTVPSK